MLTSAGRLVLAIVGGLLLASILTSPAAAQGPSNPPRRYLLIIGGTTIVVPDGGSALVASSNTFSDGRSEAGVPVLGKVPYLRRGFGNVGYGRFIRSRTVRVHVRVISLRDEEERQTGVRR